MYILPLPPATITAASQPPYVSPCPAELLSLQQRQRIALDVLAGQSISQLARRHHVSRKFIRAQRQRALDALGRAFATEDVPTQDILFYLPVTHTWLEQLTLALVLICHSSLRGVHELLRDLFDCHKSVGAIHALVQRAIAKATQVNSQQDLTCVADAALDEIFQNRRPILSVVDVASTYCCLLSLEQQRDGETWGIRLLELQDQGFAPRSLIADAGTGLRAGVELAMPGEDCGADVFHAGRDLGQLDRFLQNRAYAALAAFDKLYRRTQANQQRGKVDPQQVQRAEQARRELDGALTLADDVTVLARWLCQDVLGVAGPALPGRQELFDFVLAELQVREPLCPHRLGPLCRMLHNQRDKLLAFVGQLDIDLQSVAEYAQVSEELLRELLAVQELPQASSQRWQRDAVLHRQLGERYHAVAGLVEELRAGVVRASSVVENVNSRLRNYFFLRKEVGQGYLELLRFFLNHRRFLRSEHAGRVGKSPAELLHRQEHEHWLEMLGYQRFRRAA